ncbi:hypothetical protein PB2503_09899 [Parvularcula bermudensis HTCC2503]|uniref:Uncharacterized protein n=1 Tax=Parvularcula bermudensis (strain ATCC BAA-594 / HTCC2503 / KCTC 12087) TaxID=314260 RepID=E0TEE6_PARBH|nr:hypothetical protein [Parvularcula bermudensis]ADM10032.1 hypothetical protein PB2503_09899 [Parvularcula bermudensis HTCC2503]
MNQAPFRKSAKKWERPFVLPNTMVGSAIYFGLFLFSYANFYLPFRRAGVEVWWINGLIALMSLFLVAILLNLAPSRHIHDEASPSEDL